MQHFSPETSEQTCDTLYKNTEVCYVTALITYAR